MSPHGTSNTPGKSASATGTVRLASLAVNVYANRNSFQLDRNASSPAEARPGASSGSRTERSACARLAPSTAADSSSARGISRMNPARSQTVSGSANEVWASTSAVHVSRSRSARSRR